MVLKVTSYILTIFLMSSTCFANIILDEKLSMLTPVEKTNPAQGKKEVLVYFWATWCPDCKSKLTQDFKKNEIYEKYDVYLVSTDKNLEKVINFKNKNDLSPHVYIDLEKQLQKRLNVFSVPTIAKFSRTAQGLQLVETQTGGDINRIIK